MHPLLPDCSRALQHVHRCFIARNKKGAVKKQLDQKRKGEKKAYAHTHAHAGTHTRDLTHAPQSLLSLKSQLGVCESISMRSLGFVVLLLKVLRQGPGCEASLPGLLNRRAYEHHIRPSGHLGSLSHIHTHTRTHAHFKHILPVHLRAVDSVPNLLHTQSH